MGRDEPIQFSSPIFFQLVPVIWNKNSGTFSLVLARFRQNFLFVALNSKSLVLFLKRDLSNKAKEENTEESGLL